jgi:hypothetical protein
VGLLIALRAKSQISQAPTERWANLSQFLSGASQDWSPVMARRFFGVIISQKLYSHKNSALRSRGISFFNLQKKEEKWRKSKLFRFVKVLNMGCEICKSSKIHGHSRESKKG